MKQGYCHICQKYGNLTFEHVPPHKAFNDRRAKSIEGNEAIKLISEKDRMPWDTTGLKYKSKQRGMGIYSLCSSCNNLTGKYYGNEYIKFAQTMAKVIFDNDISGKSMIGVKLEGVYVSRIAKQVLSMFCSTYPGFTKIYPIVKDLILDKDETIEDISKFRITMFILKEFKIGYTGLTAMAYGNGKIKIVAEIDAYPFGFVLELEPKEDNPDLDITHFLSHKYDEKFDLEMGINIRERNIMFPTDFRTKEEIMACKEENNRKIEEINKQKIG